MVKKNLKVIFLIVKNKVQKNKNCTLYIALYSEICYNKKVDGETYERRYF